MTATRAKVNVYASANPQLEAWLEAFARGAARGGAKVARLPDGGAKVACLPEARGQPAFAGADLHVFWGMRSNLATIESCVAAGQPFVCLDHGYTTDRQRFSSVNLNGLNGKSALDVSDLAGDPSRCLRHGWAIRPQRPGHITFIIGQIYNDAALEGNDVYAWADRMAEIALLSGERVHFKPHPLERPAAAERYRKVRAPAFMGPMDEAVRLARKIVTFSSTAGPEAWLSGIPATAHSPMSMIHRAQRGDGSHEARQRWLNEISYRQYSLFEMASGLAWDFLAPRVIGVQPQGAPGRPCLYPLPTGEFAAELVA
jgi:hypothetical protein